MLWINPGMLHKKPLEIGNMFIIYCSNTLWFWDYYFALFQSITMPSQRTPCFQESSKQCCYFCPRLPCILAPQKCFLFSGGFDISINYIYVGLNPCSSVGISLRHFTVLISLFHRQGSGWRTSCLLPALVSLLVWGIWGSRSVWHRSVSEAHTRTTELGCALTAQLPERATSMHFFFFF